MITIKDRTLQECLGKTGLRELPKPLQEGKVWIDGIALVTRINGIESYVLVQNDGEGNPNVIRDFGPCVMINKIETIYPLNVVDKRFLPDLRSNKAMIDFMVRFGYDKEKAVSLLDKDGKTDDEIAADRATVKNSIFKIAIKLAKENLAEEERCRNLKKENNQQKTKNRIEYGE